MLERKDVLDCLVHSTDFREKITDTMYQANVQYSVPGYFACGYILVQSSFILFHASILTSDCSDYAEWYEKLEFEELTLEKLKESMKSDDDMKNLSIEERVRKRDRGRERDGDRESLKSRDRERRRNSDRPRDRDDPDRDRDISETFIC